MSKQKKSSNILKGILAVALVLLVLEVLLVVWFQRKPENLPPATDNTAETTLVAEETETLPETEGEIPESTPTVTVPAKVTEILECVNDQIPTPYFPLHYPDALADLLVVVKTADEPFSLEFYAMLEDKPEQRIFDISLSQREKGNLGTVKTETGDVYVDVTFYKFNPDDSWTKDEINTILAMQEAVNDMIAQLDLEEESTPDETKKPVVEETAPESSVVNTLTVQTPYCTLHYPVRWKDYLVTEQIENEETGVYRVLFYAKVGDREKCLLFTILFGGDEGDQLGVVLDEAGDYITVNVQFEELKLDGWQGEDVQILSAMQEAVNELIEKLPLE